MKNILKPFFLSLAVLISTVAFSQKTATYLNENRIFIEAVDLFEKEKYAAAHDKFHEFQKQVSDPNEELHISAEFYAAICSLYLFHKDAEYMLEEFVHEHPDSPWVLKVYYELATYNYKRKKHKKALEWFEHVDPRDLSNKQLPEFYFKRGHCYFERDDYEKARTDLAEVKDLDTKYQAPARYYYSHIAYSAGDNQTALDGFLPLANDPNFAPIIPYYISQIYYKLERYDELVEYTAPLLDSSNIKTTKRVPEIARLLGDSYFRKNDYAKALPYLEMYHENTQKKNISADDYYQLGFAYYSTGKYMEALDAFSECSDEENELGQSATYYMGDCYLKLDQKPYARAAFGKASEQGFNMTLKEDALFNYAKLAFELSYNPFDDAIVAFENYLEQYPDSPRRDEAYEFLLNVYMKTKNYEAALKSLDRIENKDTRTKEAYQVVAFNRGVELFKGKDYRKAEEFFDKVNTYPVNQSLIAEAIFWKAELAFKSKEYSKASNLYTQFVTQPGSVNSGFYNEANYGDGYSKFMQKKYAEATTSFRKYTDNYIGDKPKKLNDAFLRLGDCFYVIKNYTQAINYYDQAIKLNEHKVDYAMFQKAECYGLAGDDSKKIWVLKQIIDTQADSKYTADTKYSLAKTYLEKNELENARTYYQDIMSNHSNSPYVKESLVDMCLIEFKQGNDQEVIAIWNTILSNYPNDPIRTDAFRIAETILIDHEIDIPTDIVGKTELEKSVYDIAMSYASEGDCDKAIDKLLTYLNKYEPAIYATDANYYLANCYFMNGDKEKALNSYNYVVSQPISVYSEECLVAAATLTYNNKNYQQARDHYTELESIAKKAKNVLEAEIGLMRCHFHLGEQDYALQYADKVINNPDTPDGIRSTANLWRGKIRYDAGNYDDAYYDFLEVDKVGGESGAEAKYLMAKIAFAKEAYKPAEKEIFELIEKYSGYSKWKFEGFLLLVDVYLGLEDTFQAKATLQTILDNVSEPWVIDRARAKLAQIEADEAALMNEGDTKSLEINLQEEDKRDKREDENLDWEEIEKEEEEQMNDEDNND